uniref:Ig-like domain-containing protein n=1 Tax=Gouania willdenowi TaxID=441366 RepID=A0A8C5DLL9_GOUWI
LINEVFLSHEKSTKEGDRTNKKTLVCLASNFYPDHISVIWSINGNRHEGSTDSAAQRDESFYRITSRLTVNAEQWHNPDNSFTCEVNFFNGKTTITHQKTLKGVKENLLRITQNAKLSYIIFITKSCVYGAFVTFLVWKFHVC